MVFWSENLVFLARLGGETLFIDARKLGFMKDRVLRDFSKEDTEKIVENFRAWRIRSDDTPVVSKKKGDKSVHLLTQGKRI